MFSRIVGVKWSVFVLVVCFLASPAFGAVQGLVTGQVRDVWNDMNMEGVVVSASDGKFKAVTDDDGVYRINLPEGTHYLKYTMMGYDPIVKSVQVTGGDTEVLHISFNEDAFELDEVVVSGQSIGQIKALNRQKTSANLMNVVASDAFGRFPDQNAAEALDRLPGVSIERDQGEGRFVIIRGIDPHLSSASVDGVAMAAPDADTRAVLLDVLPMNVMETLVVTKALTPDMPADSIGGHVDIEMPSAYDKTVRTLMGSVGANYSDLTDEMTESLSATYGEVFGDEGQLGLLVSASWDNRDLGSDNIEADPWEEEEGEWVTEELQFREYDLTRERMGVTTNLELRPDEKNNYFLRGLYGEYEDHEYRRRTVIGGMMMVPDASGDTGLIFHEDYSDDGNEYPETEIMMKDRTETQMNLALSAGGENKFGGFTLDYTAAYSYAEQDTPEDLEFVFVNEGLSYSYSGANGDTPSVDVVSGDIDDLDSYEFDEVEDENQIVEENVWIVEANLRKDLATQNPAYLQSGVHVSIKNKTSDIEVYVSDDNPSDFDTLEGNSGNGRSEYANFPLIDKDLTDRYYAGRSDFAMEWEEADSFAEDYETDEKIYSAYLMGNMDFGNINFLVGARVEHTKLECQGYVVDEDLDEPVLGLDRKDNDYTNFLPGVHVRMNFSENLILNAAWTNTISRPLWEQTRYARVTDDDDNVEIGNPELDPYEAMNFDATLSYYLPSLGLASIGVFYKDIDNFIYAQTLDLESYELTTYNNGDSGIIYGLELAYQQKLAFLPGPLDGISLHGNLTLSESEADILPTGGEAARTIDFLRNSDMVGSVAVSYEKKGLFLRLSGTYRSAYLDSLGEEPLEDEYIDDHFQVDLSTAYAFEKVTVYANFININNETLRAYYGESGKLRQLEEYGWSARAGMKFNF